MANIEEILKLVTDFADKAHGDQMRKYSPDRYIVHPVRVMKICREYTNDISILAAALLHDVLEDTPVSKKEIHHFLSTIMNKQEVEATIKYVVELTDVYIKADYPQWNRRKRKVMEVERLAKISPEGQTVKYADIMDNCKEIFNHDVSFARIFVPECYNILKRLDKGNPDLYQRALGEIKKEMERLKR